MAIVEDFWLSGWGAAPSPPTATGDGNGPPLVAPASYVHKRHPGLLVPDPPYFDLEEDELLVLA